MSSAPLSASGRTIALAVAGSFAAAAVLFVTVVLPAEYGIDPLGTGRLLGVAAISDPAETAVIELKRDEAGNALPVRDGALTHYANGYNTNSAVLTITPYQYVEYKYYMLKDASLEFSWQASGPVAHDNHSEPDTYPDEPAVSLDKRKIQSASGTLVAPFNGLHGWYWENLTGETITVKITSAGFYDYAVELRTNHFRKRHPVTSGIEQVK